MAVVRRFQHVKESFSNLDCLNIDRHSRKLIKQFEQYVGLLKEIEQDYLIGIFLNEK